MFLKSSLSPNNTSSSLSFSYLFPLFFLLVSLCLILNLYFSLPCFISLCISLSDTPSLALAHTLNHHSFDFSFFFLSQFFLFSQYFYVLFLRYLNCSILALQGVMVITDCRARIEQLQYLKTKHRNIEKLKKLRKKKE